MAERKTVEDEPRQDATEEAVDDSKTKRTVARKYTRERLVREADAFVGHPPHVVAGALADLDQNEFSVKQVEDAVKNWLGPEE